MAGCIAITSEVSDHFSQVTTKESSIKIMQMPAFQYALYTLLAVVAAMAAVRVIIVLGVLLFCLAEVSSDLKIEEEIPYVGQLVVKDGNRRLMQEIDCGGLCKQRCSLHSRPNVCNRACGTCCVRCKCVPPGTSGNREVCGTCYTDMTTHGNKTKCP